MNDYRTRAGREQEILAEISIGTVSMEWIKANPQRKAAWLRMLASGQIQPVPRLSLWTRFKEWLIGWRDDE